MRTHILPIIALLALVTVLAACGSGEQSTPGPTAALLETATLPPSTTLPDAAAPTPEPTQPAPPTQQPTSTLLPVTPTPEPTPTSTPQAVNLSTIAIELAPLTAGLESPVFVAHADDGSNRQFVVEKPGSIVALGSDGQSQGAFLDIRARVGSNGFEQGLLGLAFHPQFTTNGRLFVYYTDKAGNTVISRFQANADRTAADPASEVVLVTAEQPAANHNGGMLAFGPDGMLYAGLGDGGRAGDPWGNAQNLDTLLGKLLRLDVDGETYAVPGDNPFVGQSGARPEIWAYGLRNPWRFSFDRATGDLWIGDVGQNQWEEIDVQPASSTGGENYGWNIMEGTRCYDAGACDKGGLVLPVAEYQHGEDGCSVTGGYVYRGSAVPALSGVYLYGDYCSGRIWGLAADASGQWQDNLLLDTNLQISSFGETEDGEVLVVDLNGAVYRLVEGG